MNEAIDIGNDKQLMLDQNLWAAREGVRLRVNRLQPDTRAVLEPSDEEQQRNLSFGYYSSVRQEEGRTRLWYFANSREDILQRRVCYAESEDGIHFTRPAVNAHLAPHNAVLSDPVQGSCVWIDPQAPAAQRYRSQAKWGPPAKFAGKGSSLHFYASPDGLDWKETHYLHLGDCDTQTVVFFDPKPGRYVMYTREWVRFEDRNLNHRKVRRLESDDLHTWTSERVVWEADAEDLDRAQTSIGRPPVDIYGACVFKYPQAGDLYIMLAQHFWHWQDRPEEERWGFSPDPENMERRIVHLGPAVIDVRLGYSHDGITFDRAVDRGPFLPVGPDGRFDSRGAWILPDPIIRDEDIVFYYAGTNRDHDGFVDPTASQRRSAIGRAVLRLDGFVGAEADAGGGWLVTPPLCFDPGELELNVAASAGGRIKVEVLDEELCGIPGFSGDDSPWLCGDSVRLPVRWAGQSLSTLAGRPVQFRFSMHEAELYSFRVVAGN